jgi:hypothetical protein
LWIKSTKGTEERVRQLPSVGVMGVRVMDRQTKHEVWIVALAYLAPIPLAVGAAVIALVVH